jgi:para-aminobenzoate synthetase
MNEKLESIVRRRAQGLQGVVSELTSRGENLSSADASRLSLWNTTAESADLSNGAQNFKSTILNTYQGRDQHVNGLTSAFDKWMDSVLEVRGIVKSMKEARWDDTFADDVDDDSDDDLGDSKQTLLSDDDPRLLEEVTQEALSQALQDLGTSFAKIVNASIESDNTDSIHKAVFILRVVREIGDRIPRLKLHERSTALASPFTSDTLQSLYKILAVHVASPTTKGYGASLATSSMTRSNNHILWEGNPPLPGQPAPSAFRFLRDLNSSMAALGNDLWAPTCVEVLKKQVADDVREIIEEHVQAINTEKGTKEEGKNEDGVEDKEATTNGDTEETKDAQPSSSRSSETRERRLRQVLFDALYVQRFIGLAEDDLAEKAKVAGLDDAAMGRLKKNAADYAKKTYLLFALLA